MKLSLTISFLVFGISGFAQSWETNLSSLPTAASERHHPATFSIDDIGYLVAGADANSLSMKDFYSYDYSTDSWTTKADFPGPSRGYSYAVSSDTKGYLGFGYQFEPGNGIDQYLFDLWEYDPISDTWTELASCPGTARIHPAMVYLNGKIYVGLGGSSSGDLGDWWEYDINTDTWTSKATFPGANRHHPYYFGIGDYVYVGMGHSGPDIFNDLYRYDPLSDSWTQMQSLPSQGRVAGTQFTYDGKGYILSGEGQTHQLMPSGEFWEYDPIADDWTELTEHPGGSRWAPGSFIVSDGIYFLCGESSNGVEKDMMRYQIGGFASTPNESFSQHYTLFPNPSKGELQLSNISDKASFVLYDLSGKECFRGNFEPASFIDVSQLKKGAYQCVIQTPQGVLRKKLLLQ